MALRHVTVPPPPAPTDIRSVCVFCGARPGTDPGLVAAAGSLGAALAGAGMTLIYGGGVDGLMGAVARGAAEAGGTVVGIVPHFIAARTTAFAGPHEMVAVPDMHSRKRAMFDRADAFVALPGGIGTIEELAEVITWHKLDQHRKPILIANFDDFWRPLLALFEHLARRGFMREDVLGGCLVADEPEAVVPMLRAAAGVSPAFVAAHARAGRSALTTRAGR